MGAVDIAVRLNTAQFNAGLAAVQGGMSGIQASADRANKQLGKFNKAFDWAGKAFAFAAGGAVVVSTFNKLIDASGNLQRSQATVNSVFGEFAGQVNAAADGAAKMGLSAADYGQYAAQLGQVFQSLGASQEYAATQSDWLIQAATDMAAAFDHPEGVTGAVKALQALFRNEYDPAERFGIVLRQSAVNAKAAAEGIDVLTAKNRLLAEELLNIRNQYDFLNAQDNPLLLKQQVSAQLENTAAKLGDALVGPFKQVTSAIEGVAKVAAAIPTPFVSAAAKVGLIVVGLKAATIVFGKLIKTAKSFGAAMTAVANAQLASRNATFAMGDGLEKAQKSANKLKSAIRSIGAAAGIFAVLTIFDKLGDAVEKSTKDVETLTYELSIAAGKIQGLQVADFTTTGWTSTFMKDVNDINQILDVVAEKNSSVWGDFNAFFYQDYRTAEAGLQNVYQAMEQLIQLDPSAAKQALAELRAEMDARGGTEFFDYTELEVLEGKLGSVATELGYGQSAFRDYALQVAQSGEDIDLANKALTDLIDTTKQSTGAFLTGAQAVNDLDGKFKGLQKNRFDKNLIPKVGDEEAAAALDNLVGSLQDVQKEAIEVGKQSLNAGDSIEVATKKAQDRYRKQAKAILEASGANDKLSKSQQKALRQIANFKPKEIKLKLKTDDPEKAIKGIERTNNKVKKNVEGNPIKPQVNADPAKKDIQGVEDKWNNLNPNPLSLTASVSVKAADANSRNILNKAGISIQSIPGMEDTVGVTAAGLAQLAEMDSIGVMAAATGNGTNDRAFYLDFIVRGSYIDDKVIEYLNSLEKGWYAADKAAEQYLNGLDRLVDKSSNLTDLTKDLRKAERELKNADSDDKKGLRKEVKGLEEDVEKAAKASVKLAKQLGLIPQKAKFTGDIKQAEKLGKELEKLSKKYRDAYDEALRAAQQYANDIYSAWSQIRDQVESSISGLFNIFSAGSEYLNNLKKAADLQKQENDLIEDKAEAQQKVNDLYADGRKNSWDPRVFQQWQDEVEEAESAVTDLQERIDGLGVETEIGLSTGDISNIIATEGAKAQEFALQLENLANSGLSPDALSQLAGLGPEMGLAYAKALQDPSIRAAYEAQAKAVNRIAERAGEAAANSQLEQIKIGLEEAAKEQEKFFEKHPLDIKVNLKISRKTRKQLKKLGIKVPKTGGASAPATVNITITGHDLTDPEGVARTVRQVWNDIDQREGRVDAFA